VNAGAPSLDLDGNPRPKDGNGDGVALVDVGCYECPANYVSVRSAKNLSNGSPAGITDATVTAAFMGRFYVETPDRISGIGVLGTSPGTGRKVSVEGSVTALDGEKLVNPTWVGDNGSAPIPAPWFMNENSLGGGLSGLQSGVSEWRLVKKFDGDGKPYYVRELFASGGASNIGLFVKVAGRVSNSSLDHFYLDGGAGIDDGDPALKGVRVDWPFGAIAPTDGDFVTVLGISSCRVVHDDTLGDIVVRMLRPISAESVVGQ
jgi:hypothetical protein